MTQPQEKAMDINENIRTEVSEDVIVLGVASIETKGTLGFGESAGIGVPMVPGISED